MPFPYGTLGIHTDNMHTGSAKRNTASGVKGVDAAQNLDPKLVMADIDAAILNAANGIMKLDAQKLIGSGILSAFNLCKIYSTNIFTEFLEGTGDIIESLANGTLQASIPANGDDAEATETDRIAPSLLPRIGVFKVNSLTVSGGSTICGFGFGNNRVSSLTHYAYIYTSNGGTNWAVMCSGGVGFNSTATTVAAGDVFVIYLTSARVSFFKNGAHVATFTTELPTNPLGHLFGINTVLGQGAGNEITLGFMS